MGRPMIDPTLEYRGLGSGERYTPVEGAPRDMVGRWLFVNEAGRGVYLYEGEVEPAAIVRYVNVFAGDDGLSFGHAFMTKSVADAYGSRIGCLRVSLKDGVLSAEVA